MIDDLARVGLSDSSFNLFDMPLLQVQICLYRFAKKISAIAVHGTGKSVESGDFVGFEAETNSLLFHMVIIQCMMPSDNGASICVLAGGTLGGGANNSIKSF